MNGTADHQERRHYSPSASITESNRLLPTVLALAVISTFLSGLSLIFTMWALKEASRAQTRADLAQLEVESFKNVLHAHQLPTSAHLPGESP